MRFWNQFRGLYQKFGRYMITVILLAVVVVMGIGALRQGQMKQKLVYPDSLDQVAAVVEEQSLTLRQVAFYVAYEEMEVNKMAVAYEEEDTNQYWNLRVDGTFVRDSARNAAIQMAIHDEIFYRMAVEEEVTLPEAEQESLHNSIEDFWNDLSDYEGADKLGIEREDIENTMEHIAYAQYYQTVYAMMQEADFQDYDFTGEEYQKLMKDYQYEINKNVWSRVDFGNVILEH